MFTCKNKYFPFGNANNFNANSFNAKKIIYFCLHKFQSDRVNWMFKEFSTKSTGKINKTFHSLLWKKKQTTLTQIPCRNKLIFKYKYEIDDGIRKILVFRFYLVVPCVLMYFQMYTRTLIIFYINKNCK